MTLQAGGFDIFSLLLKILDMQMGVTVIPCHSLAGRRAAGRRSLSFQDCVQKWDVSVNGQGAF